jgi:succinyl-CoA synthetase beta subunit
MNIHEYQAKEILGRYGLAVPRGTLVASSREARIAAENFGGKAVVKAQIHSGGRGASGGVKLAQDPVAAAALYEAFLGMRLVTRQAGPAGARVHRVYVEEALDITKELYLSLSIDRSRARVVLLGSASGGIEVESRLGEDGGDLFRADIDPVIGPTAYSVRALSTSLGLSGASARQLLSFVSKLYGLFVDLDCSLVEINPLAVTADGNLVAVDCKMAFDDNALFRHPDNLEYRDIEEGSPEEFEASKYGLSYVRLDGSIGCLVNGAGLAMATLDAISQRGGAPANFLDLGGAASEKAVRRAFEIILEDRRLVAILVNVFGGIVHCDDVARGIVSAIDSNAVRVPLVARLDGNRAEEGRAIFAKAGAECGFHVEFAGDLGEAASLATEAAARHKDDKKSEKGRSAPCGSFAIGARV